jgi:hypothetical protein
VFLSRLGLEVSLKPSPPQRENKSVLIAVSHPRLGHAASRVDKTN